MAASVLELLLQALCLLLPYFSVEKKEESMDDDVVEEEESPFVDDPKDESFLPYSHR